MDYAKVRADQYVRFTGPGPNKGQVGKVHSKRRGTLWVQFIAVPNPHAIGTNCFAHHLVPVTRREREVALAAVAFGIKEAPPCDTESRNSASGTGIDASPTSAPAS